MLWRVPGSPTVDARYAGLFLPLVGCAQSCLKFVPRDMTTVEGLVPVVHVPSIAPLIPPHTTASSFSLSRTNWSHKHHRLFYSSAGSMAPGHGVELRFGEFAILRVKRSK